MTNTNKKYWVSELDSSSHAYLIIYAYKRLEQESTLGLHERIEYVNDLINEKLDNLEELVPTPLMEYLCNVPQGTPLFGQLYYIYDLQDFSDQWVATLDEARAWLVDFWNNNPDDEMSDEDHEYMLKEILSANANELDDKLQGIDYGLEEVE